ncbi:MAG TPA: M20/M25/M40 family metallo-hydrolase [Gemmatimonadaceae bacterium]|nr:M20/M25/M40 family metallo-hydrolase [Gemmatimonadaceae bacterium]
MNRLHAWSFALTLLSGSASCATTLPQPAAIGIEPREGWSVENRTLSTTREGNRAVLVLSDTAGDGIAWANGILFDEGVIEVELRGRDLRQRSFLGIAFRGVDASLFDVVYFRPFNFHAADSAARSHAVQYQSFPHWPWPRTRSDWPGVFEQGLRVAPVADDWFRARIVLRDRRVKVFVNDDADPVLDVPELTDRRGGRIGLWVGTRSNGHFANLRLRPDAPRSATAEDGPISLARQVRDAALQSDSLISDVRELSRLGGRPPGTRADSATRRWLTDRLQALGPDSVWTEMLQAPRWVRGREELTTLGARMERMPILQLGLSVPTPDTGVAGELIRFLTSADAAVADPATVKGRIVFIDHVMPRGRDGTGFATVGQRRGDAVAHAGQAGALAVVIRGPGTGKHALPHAANIGYRSGMPAIPVASLSNVHADRLAVLLEEGPLSIRLFATGRDSATVQTANVIAEIRGREFSDEIALFGAHHDSWDVGSGALDDGAGVAMVLEALRRLRTIEPPRRTVRFVFFGAEELGLRGARTYLQRNERVNHVVALEADQGAGRAYRLRTPRDQLPEPLLAAMEGVLIPLGIQRVRERSFAGPDLIPFRERGVFTLDVAQDMTDFWDHAHSAQDTFDRIRPADLRATAAAYAAAVTLAAWWPRSLRQSPAR